MKIIKTINNLIKQMIILIKNSIMVERIKMIKTYKYVQDLMQNNFFE